MKKIFALLLTVFALTSCIGPQGPVGPPGEGMNWDVINFTINSADWNEDRGTDGMKFYYYEITGNAVEKLTDFVVNSGTIDGYIYNSLSSDLQNELPYVRYYKDGNVYYSENIDYDFTNHKITVYVSSNDGQSSRPATTKFRFVLQW